MHMGTLRGDTEYGYMFVQTWVGVCVYVHRFHFLDCSFTAQPSSGHKEMGEAVGQGLGAISCQLACTGVLLLQLTYKLCD